MRTKFSKAFSLAELLTVIWLLGIISTYTIPKIIVAQQQQQKKAVFKEAAASLNAIIYNGSIQPSPVRTTTIAQYVMQNVGAVKVCSGGAVADGCYQAANLPYAWMNTPSMPGAVLHSGAVIIIEQNSGDDWVYIMVDWNGNTTPNMVGDDQLLVATSINNTFGFKPGVLFCFNDGGANNTLCNQIGISGAG